MDTRNSTDLRQAYFSLAGMRATGLSPSREVFFYLPIRYLPFRAKGLLVKKALSRQCERGMRERLLCGKNARPINRELGRRLLRNAIRNRRSRALAVKNAHMDHELKML